MRCRVWVPDAVDLAGAPEGAAGAPPSALLVALGPGRRLSWRLPPLPAPPPPVAEPGRRQAVAQLAARLRGADAPPGPGAGVAGAAAAALAAVAAADLAVPGPPLAPALRCAVAAWLLARDGLAGPAAEAALWACSLGGVAWVRGVPGGWQAERVPLEGAAWRRLRAWLLVADLPGGAPGPAPELTPAVHPRPPDPAAAAAAALLAGDGPALAAAVGGDHAALAPALRPAATAALAAGALAVRPSRLVPGRLVVLATPSRRPAVALALRAAGASPLPVRPVDRGLQVRA